MPYVKNKRFLQKLKFLKERAIKPRLGKPEKVKNKVTLVKLALRTSKQTWKIKLRRKPQQKMKK